MSVTKTMGGTNIYLVKILVDLQSQNVYNFFFFVATKAFSDHEAMPPCFKCLNLVATNDLDYIVLHSEVDYLIL